MSRTKKPWTCLFYLCGDNYLAKYLEDDFREICAAGASPSVHVAVQIDRPTGAARYLLPERRQRRPAAPDHTLGNVNTGDPNAAIDFLTWGMRECPSPPGGDPVRSRPSHHARGGRGRRSDSAGAVHPLPR